MATHVKDIDWAKLAREYKKSLTTVSLRTLARKLGVTRNSLRALGVGWRQEDDAWTFPERDGRGNIIGILRRFADGRKQVIAGSRRGLYLPSRWRDREGPLLIPEGVTDVAALLSRGIRAIGRPACTGGITHLIEALEETDIDVVVVGENDEKEDGTWPGRDGAKKVAAALSRALGDRVRWTLPPDEYKDVREFICEVTSRGEQ